MANGSWSGARNRVDVDRWLMVVGVVRKIQVGRRGRFDDLRRALFHPAPVNPLDTLFDHPTPIRHADKPLDRA